MKDVTADPLFNRLQAMTRQRGFFGVLPLLGREVDVTLVAYERDELASLRARAHTLLHAPARIDAEARAHVARAAASFVDDLQLLRIKADDRGGVELTYRSDARGGTRVLVHRFEDDEDWRLTVRGDGLRRGEMPLVLDGDGYPIRSAKFLVSLATESWSESRGAWLYGIEHVSVRYALEIDVDDGSGEDGMPYPMATIPATRVHGGRPPNLTELPGIAVDDEGDWEAHLGNDAPPLENNRLTFGPWSGRRIGIRWEAEYEQRRRYRFLFDGEAELDVISIQVKNEADADSFMNAMFGARYVATLEKGAGEWFAYGDSMPADRRRWFKVAYRPR